MKTALNTVDWVVCLAWSLGHAILTALVPRTAVNAAVTFDAILLSTARESARRWVGRCSACRKAHRVDGMLARGCRGGHDEMVVVSGAWVYRIADHGSNPTALFVSCCDGRVKLQRVSARRPGASILSAVWRAGAAEVAHREPASWRRGHRDGHG